MTTITKTKNKFRLYIAQKVHERIMKIYDDARKSLGEYEVLPKGIQPHQKQIDILISIHWCLCNNCNYKFWFENLFCFVKKTETKADDDTPILIGNGSSETEVLIGEQKVIFRRFRDGDIIALFPEDIDNNYTIASYMHVGQHSGANYDHVVSKTKPAKESEYADLLNELVRVGYTNLRIMKKCRPKFS